MDVRSDIFPGTPDGFHPRDVSVRLARPDERIRWDRLMNQHHYLGFKRFPGRGLPYVFEWRGQWVGLAGWQSGAFKCRPRDQWIGWKRELQFTRMHLIANNTRFLILGAPGCFPNLASFALAAMVQRLSADWSAAYGHSLLLAETFVDPSKFCGYMYKEAGWTQLGRTKGYARANGRYTVPHGVLKDLVSDPKVCCLIPKGYDTPPLKHEKRDNRMPWDKTNRTKYDYKTGRYPSDMTNAQWAVIEPLVPLPKHGGRPRTTDMREVINAISYIGRTGCQWRLLPQPFPPWTTVQRYFYEWTKTGVLAEMNDIMVASVRTAEGRFPDPTAGVIDSQSVKTTESGGVFGYDAGKKIKGRKRHIVTDTLGYLLMIHVHTANIQDRDGAVDLLKELGEKFPNLRHVFADGGYRGPKLKNAMGEEWTIQTIMRSHDEKGFDD